MELSKENKQAEKELGKLACEGDDCQVLDSSLEKGSYAD